MLRPIFRPHNIAEKMIAVARRWFFYSE